MRIISGVAKGRRLVAPDTVEVNGGGGAEVFTTAGVEPSDPQQRRKQPHSQKHGENIAVPSFRDRGKWAHKDYIVGNQAQGQRQNPARPVVQLSPAPNQAGPNHPQGDNDAGAG